MVGRLFQTIQTSVKAEDTTAVTTVDKSSSTGTSHMMFLQGVQSNHGKGKIVLEVTCPSLAQHEGVIKRSEVVSLQSSYPLKILAPEHAGLSVCRWIYPVNFGGGLVGGDHIDITVSLGNNCAALVTTQESTKVYHCRDAQETQQNMEYFLHGTTFLAILGDPVVCFADAQFYQTQKVHMSEDSNIVLLDWLTAGRVALEEIWNFKSYQSLVEVYIDKHLVFKDNQRLSDGPYFTLREAMGNFQVLGMCVVLGDRMHNLVEHVKQLYGTPHSISQPLSKDLLCSYSPLNLEYNNKVINGCYIRFVATSTTLAYSVVQQVTSCLMETLGGDPFRKKY